jgi:hypothetical protein
VQTRNKRDSFFGDDLAFIAYKLETAQGGRYVISVFALDNVSSGDYNPQLIVKVEIGCVAFEISLVLSGIQMSYVEAFVCVLRKAD